MSNRSGSRIGVRRTFLAVSAAVVVASSAGMASAADWAGWNIHVADHPNTVAMDKFAELLGTKTDGEIKLKMFHAGTLGNHSDAIGQVRIGGLEIGNFNLGPMARMIPETSVVSLPFIFNDVGHMHRALDGEAGQRISDLMAKKGLIALAWYDAGARSFYNAQKPITKPEDIAGMKVRMMNNDLYSAMVEALGGIPMSITFSEVYQSLKIGAVDGAENNWPAYEATGHFEFAGYYSLSQHMIVPECVCINAEVFNDLSNAHKAAVKAAAVEAALLQRKLWEVRAGTSRKKVLASGVKVNEIADKAPFQAAMQPVYDAYLAANPDIKPLVALIQHTD